MGHCEDDLIKERERIEECVESDRQRKEEREKGSGTV